MKTPYIYVVGKPDPTSTIVDRIHELGYRVGILVDDQATGLKLDHYDHVVTVNYSQLDAELPRLKELDLTVAGLVCTYENYIVAKATIGTFFDVPTLSVASARLATDKSLMRKAFLAADRSISPDYTTADSLEEALAFARTHTYPLIIKPTNLVKSLLVLRCDNEAQLIERFTYASETIGELYKKYNIYDRVPQLIVEEFIVGEQYSIAAFVDAKGNPHFCDGIVSLKNAQDINVDDNFLYKRSLPAQLPEELTKRMYEVAATGVRALQMTSVPAHIELMAGPAGVKIIEIGARIGGYRPRMYQYSYGVDLPLQEVHLALGQSPVLKGAFSAYCAVYELFPESEGLFDGIAGSLNPEDATYYRVVAKTGAPVGPAKNGYKATAIIIITHTEQERFTQLCSQAETAYVKVTT